MKNLFQLLAKPRLKRKKISLTKATSAFQRDDAKIESYIPTTFDFTAYFDDNELESNATDIPHVNTSADTETNILCVIDEKCNEMLYSLKSQPFECCIN